MVDLDGKFTISNILLLKNTAALFIAYPNPVRDQLSIQVNGQGPAILKLVDLTGRLIEKRSIQLDNNIHSIDMNEIPRGFYYLILDTGSGTQKIKLVKQ